MYISYSLFFILIQSNILRFNEKMSIKLGKKENQTCYAVMRLLS
jgi:hypothetical protein